MAYQCLKVWKLILSSFGFWSFLLILFRGLQNDALMARAFGAVSGWVLWFVVLFCGFGCFLLFLVVVWGFLLFFGFLCSLCFFCLLRVALGRACAGCAGAGIWGRFGCNFEKCLSTVRVQYSV